MRWADFRPVYVQKMEADLLAIAEAIHYPGCWDTAAYPTLLDAIKEFGCNPECCTKKN